MASVGERFARAEKLFNEKKDTLPENLKMKLYGLAKQVKEGDCRMPMPPSSNAVLRAKWDAWTSYVGYESDRAMMEFVSLIERIEKTVEVAVEKTETRRPTFTPRDRRTSLRVGQNMLKQGTLYKQRDHFKGWRPRQFTLVDNTLSYFVENDDLIPRGALVLDGCTCLAQAPIQHEGMEFYPFTLSHPGNAKPFKLSAVSKAEADEWVAKINNAARVHEWTDTGAAAGAGAARTPVSPTRVGAAVVRVTPPAKAPGGEIKGLGGLFGSVEGEDPASTSAPSTPRDVFGGGIVNAGHTLQGVPAHLTAKLETKVGLMFDAIAPDGGWELFMDRQGVRGLKRPGQGSLDVIRADAVMPFNILDVFNTVTSKACQFEMDPMRRQQDKLRLFSPHSWAEYFRFKEVWPVSGRDFVDFYHWRLLADGTVVVLAFSEKFDDLKAPQTGLVRGDTTLTGYVLKPVAGKGAGEGGEGVTGTEVHFIVETDPKGSLPTSIVNQVCLAQPKALILALKILQQRQDGGALLRDAAATVSYADFASIMAKNIADSSEGATTTTTTSATTTTTATAATATATAATTAAAQPKRSSIAGPITSPPSTGLHLVRLVKTLTAHSLQGYERLLLALLLPAALFYLVGGVARSVAFLLGLLIALKQWLSLHLGAPAKRSQMAQRQGQVPAGRTVVRIPVDLGHLLRYLDSKRQDSNIDVTITHITVKACAAVLSEMPALNGHVVDGAFYRAGQGQGERGVDVSWSLDLSESESVLLKVCDADVKSVDAITTEIVKRGKSLREEYKRPQSSLRSRLLDLLTPAMAQRVDSFLQQLGTLGVAIPALDVVAFPAGVCAVITSPSMEGDVDVDLSIIPGASAPPFIVSIGSVRVLASLNAERNLTGAPVLNYSVSVDNRAASAAECRKFCARLQKYLRSPSLLEVKAKVVGVEEVRRKSLF